jgi:hypothetical protein
MTAPVALVAAVALPLLLFAAPADGHAILVHPPSRNWMLYLQKNLQRPHELNMGGEAANAIARPRFGSVGGVRAAWSRAEAVN